MIYVHVCFRYYVWTVSMCFAMPVNMPSTELVFFSMSVSMSAVTVSMTLSDARLSVSGQIRVRDNARYHCCFPVSVSGSDRERCGVRARGRVRSRLWQIMFPLLFPWCQWPCDQWPCDQWPVTLSVTEFVSSVQLSMTVSVSVSMSMSGPYPSCQQSYVSVSVSVFLIMPVIVDQCPCSRDHVSVCDRVGVHDRDRVRGRVRYILSVSVVVPIMSSVRGCGLDHA